MKILNKKEFLKLPNGTVFSNYEDIIFSGLYIKGDSNLEVGIFIYRNLLQNIDGFTNWEEYEIVNSAKENKTSFTMNLEIGDCNKSFDDSEMFVIYEKRDLEQLIGKLNQSYNKLYTEGDD